MRLQSFFFFSKLQLKFWTLSQPQCFLAYSPSTRNYQNYFSISFRLCSSPTPLIYMITPSIPLHNSLLCTEEIPPRTLPKCPAERHVAQGRKAGVEISAILNTISFPFFIYHSFSLILVKRIAVWMRFFKSCELAERTKPSVALL